MRRIFVLIAMLVGCAFPRAGAAFEQGVYSTETFNETFVYPNIPQYAPTPEGGLSWELFAQTTETYEYGTGAQANFILSSTPAFSHALEMQDGREVVMAGYMFPLEDTAGQRRFLFGPFPAGCPFHYHVPPTLVIEVDARVSVPLTYELLQLRGRLELVQDARREPYYRMHDAMAMGEVSPADAGKPLHPLYGRKRQMSDPQGQRK